MFTYQESNIIFTHLLEECLQINILNCEVFILIAELYDHVGVVKLRGTFFVSLIDSG